MGNFPIHGKNLGPEIPFLGRLGFYWERRSTFLLHPNTGNMLWMFPQVIPKAGNNMVTFPKLFPVGWIMGYISSSYSQNCEKYGHTSPSYSQNCEKYGHTSPSYSQYCEWCRSLYPELCLIWEHVGCYLLLFNTCSFHLFLFFFSDMTVVFAANRPRNPLG